MLVHLRALTQNLTSKYKLFLPSLVSLNIVGTIAYKMLAKSMSINVFSCYCLVLNRPVKYICLEI